jgi:hypothetical protein
MKYLAAKYAASGCFNGLRDFFFYLARTALKELFQRGFGLAAANAT